MPRRLGPQALEATRAQGMEKSHDKEGGLEEETREDRDAMEHHEHEEEHEGHVSGEAMHDEIEDDDDEGEDDDDEEEEEDEPQLKYQRVGSSVGDILAKDTTSAICVYKKFMVLATHWGAIHVLDFDGNTIQSFKKHHSATVNDISVDDAGEYVATASDDGK
ncbi:hypothetical protein BZG36_02828 [Bifiguratus adelaidae]|uniref:Vps41 beta-propeller domain-containing protein n=1 Tax=Bifiguratus adelaidae TaxID=1938954 RepID=A0A261Y0I3_9FUNG|nr:hypothetical protein BZG36_02828 [Bifiguratus adelaidae]